MTPRGTQETVTAMGPDSSRVLTDHDRIAGGIWGALVGDALGVPVEFEPRSDRDRDPVTGPRAYGTWNQPAGTWSDDGAMLLCLAEALMNGGALEEAARLYVRWWQAGHQSARGEVFDIGNATRTALQRIKDGAQPEHAGGDTEFDNGNGSLMRTLPVALWYGRQGVAVVAEQAMRHSRATHRHARSQLACAFKCLAGHALMRGQSPLEAWRRAVAEFRTMLDAHPGEQGAFTRLIDDAFPRTRREEIRSDGYVIDTLEASIWCLLQGGSFEEIVLRSINLGGDTDTTGCVAGGLAGVWLGAGSIPHAWKVCLPRTDEVEELIGRFVSAEKRDATRSA